MRNARLKVGIRNLKVSTLIGVFAHERLAKRDIILNLEMEILEKGISIRDQLCDTVDYAMVATQLSDWMKTQSSQLLEHLAYLTILKVFELDSRIEKIRLEIFKPSCIPNADGAFVTLSCTRNENSINESASND